MQLRAIRSDSCTYVQAIFSKQEHSSPFQVIFEADTMSNSENCSRWFDVLEKRIPIFPLSILFLWKSFCSVDGEFHFFHFV